MRAIPCAVVLVFAAPAAFGQTASAPAAFEVASVKASKASGEGGRRDNIQVSPGSLSMRNVSLKTAIRWAYHVMDFQVSGPDWLGNERYDIMARRRVLLLRRNCG